MCTTISHPDRWINSIMGTRTRRESKITIRICCSCENVWNFEIMLSTIDGESVVLVVLVVPSVVSVGMPVLPVFIVTPLGVDSGSVGSGPVGSGSVGSIGSGSVVLVLPGVLPDESLVSTGSIGDGTESAVPAPHVLLI